MNVPSSALQTNSPAEQPIWSDPIVDEVRAIREEYSKRFDYDLQALHADLLARQAASGRAYVTLPPKRIEPANGSVKPPSDG